MWKTLDSIYFAGINELVGIDVKIIIEFCKLDNETEHCNQQFCSRIATVRKVRCLALKA